MKEKMVNHVSLNSIATVYNGNSINKKVKQEKYTSNVPGWNFIATKDVKPDGTVEYKNGIVIPFSEDRFKRAPAGSVFVCAEGGSAGKKTAYISEEVCFGNKLYAIASKKDAFIGKYLYYYTRTNHFYAQFQSLMSGIIGGVSAKNFGKIIIPLHPLPKQERIVAKLDELFSDLDAAEAELKQAKARLEVYKKSVLSEASKGVYTKIFREKNNLPKWKQVKIEKLLSPSGKSMTTGPFGTMLTKKEHQKNGIPVLGIENIGDGKFLDDNKIFVSEQKAFELQSFEVSHDDIIISRSGTVGKLCVVPERVKKALLSTNLIRLKLNNNIILPNFFVYLFLSKGVVLDQIKELCKGSTRAFLNQTILKNIQFPLPSIDEQKIIVQEIKSRLSKCETVEHEITELIHKLIFLKHSILKQTFEGRL